MLPSVILAASSVCTPCLYSLLDEREKKSFMQENCCTTMGTEQTRVKRWMVLCNECQTDFSYSRDVEGYKLYRRNSNSRRDQFYKCAKLT